MNSLSRISTFFLFVILCLVFPSLCLSEDSGLHLNKVIEKLEKGKLVTGIWGLSRSLANARSIIAFNGYPTQDEAINRPMIDFILVAMEHYPYDIKGLRAFIAGLNSKREVLAKGNLQSSLAVFVRIPEEGADPVHARIKQVLDVGAHGVVVPHVRNAEEARKIVRACRYVRPKGSPYREPQGTRGFSPAIPAYFWGVSNEEYYRRADVWPLNPDGDIMVIVMIEDTEGVRNVDDIVKVPGIGAIFFGPGDYTVSSGNQGNENFDVNEALHTVKRACDNAGVPLIYFAGPDNIKEMVRENHRMLIIGSDIDKTGRTMKVLDILRETK
ncbi:HpcH/HpaI aldolase/citrate lyase family protein [Candidatus Latescibacterota bacterium]